MLVSTSYSFVAFAAPSSESWCTNLHVALGDIEGGDTGVGDTAGEDTTEHALGIVGGVVGDRPEISGGGKRIRDARER